VQDNPFQPPEASTSTRPTGVQATAGSRFLARSTDDLALVVIAGIPVFVMVFAVDWPSGDPVWRALQLIPGAITGLAFSVWQWRSLATEGTTLGKRLLDIRVVDATGRPPGFFPGVVMREWALTSIRVALGNVGVLVSLADAVMVFSDEGRTLHDRLAGTRVVRGSTPGAFAPDADDLDYVDP